MDISSNVDDTTGKSYGFIKKSQISNFLKKYDKIFILPKNSDYNLKRHKDLKNKFKIIYPKKYTDLKKDNIFMLLSK